MNYLIVEDNTASFLFLKRLLIKIDSTATFNENLVDSRAKLRKALAQQYSYDIIFLDIQLVDGLCFDVLKDVSLVRPVVFTTGFDEFAIEAFDYNGVAYLLKPIQEDKLVRAIRKAKVMNVGAEVLERLDKVCNENAESTYVDQLLIHNQQGISIVKCSDIVYIETNDGRHCNIYTLSGKCFSYNSSLTSIMKRLDPNLFFMASRSYCVAIMHIKSLTTTITRGGEITLDNVSGYISISRDKRKELKHILGSKRD
jgi:two-component system LytT family response regulator